jgi:hypothetical protein
VLGGGLLKEFPNPERVGCPRPHVLKRIASHEMPLSEAEKWLEHLTSCSPCYRDFSKLRAAQKQRRMRTFLAVAAGILIVACLAGWAFLRSKEPLVGTAMLDLRNRSTARGTEPSPSEPPLEISRDVSRLEIRLPLGSLEGSYDLRVSTPEGESLFSGAGVANIQQGITVLRIDMNLSKANPGLYLLQLRHVGSDWNSYPLRIR